MLCASSCRNSRESIEGGSLEGGSLEGGSFEGGNLEGVSLEGGSLDGGNLEGGNLEGGSLEGGSLEGDDRTAKFGAPGPALGDPSGGISNIISGRPRPRFSKSLD